ncbi:MAG: phosphatase PAP2 family protein [Balneolales bacterium]|nr:phosphatase PAP2 family protein [Balneolales bacterium]
MSSPNIVYITLRNSIMGSFLALFLVTGFILHFDRPIFDWVQNFGGGFIYGLFFALSFYVNPYTIGAATAAYMGYRWYMIDSGSLHKAYLEKLAKQQNEEDNDSRYPGQSFNADYDRQTDHKANKEEEEASAEYPPRVVWEDKAFVLGAFILISVAITYLLKLSLGRSRPDMLLGDGFYGFFGFQTDRLFHSMPSGHASAVAALASAVYFFKPGGREVSWVIVAAVIISAGRIILGEHYASDVIAGIWVGTLTVYWGSLLHTLLRTEVY